VLSLWVELVPGLGLEPGPGPGLELEPVLEPGPGLEPAPGRHNRQKSARLPEQSPMELKETFSLLASFH